MPIRYGKLRKTYRHYMRKKGRNIDGTKKSLVKYIYPKLHRNLIGFPNKQIVKMRYVQAKAFSNGSSVPYIGYFWSANSIYDPDASGTGHQPLGHDQWSAFYNHYVVVYSKCSVSFIKTGTGGTVQPLNVGIHLVDDASYSPADMETVLEQGLAKFKALSTSGNMGNQRTIVKHSYSPRRFFNITNIRDNIKTLGASFGAGPTEQAYYLVLVGNPIGDSVIDGVTAIVTIDYYVAMSEPKELAKS